MSGDPNKNEEKRLAFDKSLGTAAGLSKLLPTGTTLAFQAMAPSFTNGGECEDHDVNFAFTWGLIGFLTLVCALLSFTDSVTDEDGNTYYGVATGNGFHLFNEHHLKKEELCRLKKEKRLKWQDWLHAVLSAAVFLALAFCDAGVQRCLVPRESQPWHDFLNHLPLAVGFLASSVFVIFPSTRKGIGEDGAWDTTASSKSKEETENKAYNDKSLSIQKSLRTAATLSKLLPTGTTLAFQTMAPSFTKGGTCNGHGVNFAFTWGLIVLLTLLCALLSFTDSVTDEKGNTYYGVATVCGFKLFDRHLEKNLGQEWENMKKSKRLRRRDFLHALTRAAVFVALAFCDAGVQGCLVPAESTQWKEFLAILPLAVSFLASFVFIIYPSSRKGIGEESAWVDSTSKKTDGENDSQHSTNSNKGAQSPLQVQVQVQPPMSNNRVAPSNICVELEPVV